MAVAGALGGLGSVLGAVLPMMMMGMMGGGQSAAPAPSPPPPPVPPPTEDPETAADLEATKMRAIQRRKDRQQQGLLSLDDEGESKVKVLSSGSSSTKAPTKLLGQ